MGASEVMAFENHMNNEGEFRIRYYNSNPFGQHLYYIEVKELDGLQDYFFETSLKLDVFLYPQLKHIINVISKRSTSPSVRKLFADRFFQLAPELIQGIEKYYFPQATLDKYGKYNEAWSNCYEQILENNKLIPYVPFSKFCNSNIFFAFNQAFKAQIFFDELRVETTRELFEEQLINDDLKDAYVEVFSPENKYYFQEERQNEEIFEFQYLTTGTGELLLLFIVKIR